jgi:hypothetical protein
MDVIINSVCNSAPVDSKPLVTQGKALLNLLVSLGYDALNPPLADLLKSSLNLKGNWLVVSPVHWQATHNDAMIVATGEELHQDETQAKYWFQLYADFLAEENIKLYYYDSETWLLCADIAPAIKAKPVYQIINHSLMPELAQLDSTMYWQKVFTECQMFFANQPNNPSINGVWIWGGAPLEEKKSIAVCADEHFFPLAQMCSAQVTLYHPSVSLKQFQVLLLNNTDILSEQHKEQLNKMPAFWYWNNSTYTRNNYNWFTRLWRSLTYAH